MSELPKSVALYMTEGASDKEYRVQLEPVNNGWKVNYQNGRRGKALKHGTKTEAPLPYSQALSVFDKLVASKKKGGYTESEDGRAFTDLPEGKQHSGVRVQLLGEVNAHATEQIIALMEDESWVAQQKHDGERRVIIKNGSDVIGTNREGILVPIDQRIVAAMQSLDADAIIVDGEDMGSHVVLFDILRLGDLDVRKYPLAARIGMLENLVDKIAEKGAGDVLRYGQMARTTEEKWTLYEQVKQHGQEGLVFKHVDSPYTEGRGDSQLKLKFKASATCEVIERNAAKRSAAIGVILADSLKAIGNVTLPPNVDVKPGDMIEVEYLYAYEGGSLFQPVFKSERPDKSQPDRAESLKLKKEDVILDVETPEWNDLVHERLARERMRSRG